MVWLIPGYEISTFIIFASNIIWYTCQAGFNSRKTTITSRPKIGYPRLENYESSTKSPIKSVCFLKNSKKSSYLFWGFILSVSVLRTIEKSELVSGIKDNIYPTVHDAVLAAQMKLGPSRHLDVHQRHAYDNQSFIPNQWNGSGCGKKLDIVNIILSCLNMV